MYSPKSITTSILSAGDTVVCTLYSILSGDSIPLRYTVHGAVTYTMVYGILSMHACIRRDTLHIHYPLWMHTCSILLHGLSQGIWCMLLSVCMHATGRAALRTSTRAVLYTTMEAILHESPLDPL
jgi:hypothetical protein